MKDLRDLTDLTIQEARRGVHGVMACLGARSTKHQTPTATRSNPQTCVSLRQSKRPSVHPKAVTRVQTLNAEGLWQEAKEYSVRNRENHVRPERARNEGCTGPERLDDTGSETRRAWRDGLSQNMCSRSLSRGVRAYLGARYQTLNAKHQTPHNLSGNLRMNMFFNPFSRRKVI